MPVITKEEFLENMYQAFLKKVQINEFTKQRVAEETALSEEYKVNEINSKRAALVDKYNALTQTLKAELQDLQTNSESRI